MLMLDADSAPVEGLATDLQELEAAMDASYELLSAICRARGLAEPERPERPQRLTPKPRARDYILIGFEPPQIPDDNPFFARFNVVTRLIDSVALGFDITHGELIGSCRGMVYVDARAVVAKILHERGYSTPVIGRFMRRDHSTVLNLLKKWPIFCRRNPVVCESYRKHTAWLAEVSAQ